MTLAPAVAAIHEMQRLGLVERAAELAPYVEAKLQALKARHPSIGDVRGKGLFWAVELVKDRLTKQPFNTYTDKVSGTPLVVDQIAAKCMADGVILQAWVSHFVLAPPLIVTLAEIDRGNRYPRPSSRACRRSSRNSRRACARAGYRLQRHVRQLEAVAFSGH